MASLRDIRKRIKSVKNTRQITKAMKMVAAAKLRRSQDAVLSARPFSRGIDGIIAELAKRQGGEPAHPLLASRPVAKTEIVAFTSDRGLAGGFNANVTKRLLKLVKDANGTAVVSTVGRKAADFCRARSIDIRKDYVGMTAKVNADSARALAEELTARFVAGEVDSVQLVYNEFVSAIAQKVVTVQLLPLSAGELIAQHGGSDVEFKYEPSATEVLDNVVPRAIANRVFQALLESSASEHAARMAAMENATKNAGDMIGNLSLYYNRTRQALITKELMEIVSGAEALK